MPKIKPFDLKFLVEEIFGNANKDPGYILDFSNKTFDEFFDAEVDINIADQKYCQNSGSKANRLRAFLQIEDGKTVAKALRSLWEYRDSIYGPFDQQDPKVIYNKNKFFTLVHAIESETDTIRTDSIDRFSENETLDELVTAIERDIQAKKPQAALDRLHTYCMKKFSHLLEQNGSTVDKEDPLHSRVGKYIKLIEAKGNLQGITLKIMKSSISIFDSFNATRNDASFAHDNELVEKHEARFIFDSIVGILRFLKNIETSKFGS